MTAIINWFAMSGYASYVWSAYGIVALVIAFNLVQISYQRAKALRILRRWVRQS